MSAKRARMGQDGRLGRVLLGDMTVLANFARIGVLGAGAWGTALANVAARAGGEIVLWTRFEAAAAAMDAARENIAYLPGVALEEGVCVTDDIAQALACDAVLCVSPAQHVRGVLLAGGGHLRPGLPIVLCSKGVEQASLALMSTVLAQAAPQAQALVLSGPGFAKDVARGLPTATTIAGPPPLAEQLALRLASLAFRPYVTDDLIGAQIGGAVKNVIAIACGIAQGAALGESARAALITRGFAEMTRLGVALGGRLDTLNGLSGLGDLVLTCTSLSSRNMALGLALGEGRSLQEALAGKRSVAEGAASAPAVLALAHQANVDMPICAAVAAVLDSRLSVTEAIGALLARPLRSEGGS